MKGLILILKIIGWIIVITTSMFSAFLFLYMSKQVHWETEVKNYKKNDDGSVTNRQGMRINASQLLDELMGIEERIAK